jgi:hypothetical protein
MSNKKSSVDAISPQEGKKKHLEASNGDKRGQECNKGYFVCFLPHCTRSAKSMEDTSGASITTTPQQRIAL